MRLTAINPALTDLDHTQDAILRYATKVHNVLEWPLTYWVGLANRGTQDM